MKSTTLLTLIGAAALLVGAASIWKRNAHKKHEAVSSSQIRLLPQPATLTDANRSDISGVETTIDPANDLTDFEDAQFVNEKTGWVRSRRGIYQTVDGGKSWAEVTKNIPSGAELTAMSLVDESCGWLATNSSKFGYGGPDDYSEIFVTKDGARSWTSQLRTPPAIHLYQIRFFDRMLGLAFGEKITGPRSIEIVALWTDDGGANWQDISARLNTPELLQLYDRILSVDWVNPSSITILTLSGQVISTSDRGEAWKPTISFGGEGRNGFRPSTGFYKVLRDPRGNLSLIAGAWGDEGYWGDFISRSNQGAWNAYELIRLPLRDAFYEANGEIVACGLAIEVGDELRSKTRNGIILSSQDAGKNWTTLYRSDSRSTLVRIKKIAEGKYYALSESGGFIVLSRARV
jgi:photosystem II stability/assembly factor-like uncharacterized protein